MRAEFEEGEAWARHRDESDALKSWRAQFALPQGKNGETQLYFCGNSLGLMPKAARLAVEEVLQDWETRAVDAHFDSRHPWMPYHEFLRRPLARLVGAKPGEVVAMNSLTVNLHLMMVSFYRPSAGRYKIVIEQGAFPSDRHAVTSQLAYHGYDPDTALVEIAPGAGSAIVEEENLESWLEAHGEDVALVLWPGVQYYTGQSFDLGRISRAARKAGAAVGFDLAHAASNVPLHLHDTGCDFAVWCSYKYLNSGPGAVAGCFVHERHASAPLPRFQGWWGHEQASRFEMGPAFKPAAGADAWQLSNPPILAMAPVRASLEIFDDATMGALRAKSQALTGYLAYLLERRLGGRLSLLTPAEPARRGCQLSLRVQDGDGRRVHEQLQAADIVCDWREPDVIRVAPVPLYNRFIEVYRLVAALESILARP